MRIALFSDTLWPQVNGVSLTLARLTEYLSSNGCQVLAVGPRAGSENGYRPRSGVRTARVPGVPVPRYPELRLAAPWSRRVREVTAEFAPHVIHAVTEFSIGWQGLRFARSTDTPIVSSFHTDFPRYIEYYGLGALSEGLWRYLRWFHLQTRCTFCPSDSILQRLEERGFGDVRLWGRGVDTERFSPRHRDRDTRTRHGPPGTVHLLYVGRLAPEKDLDVLFRAVKRLADLDVHLVVTGDGPYAETARARAPENTTFTGYLTGRELSAAYASADVFVFPSRTETYGNAVLEALASGLPVTAFSEGGVLENVRHGHNGLLCPPGDTAAFAAAVRRLATDAELRGRLGQAARDWALRRTWENAFGELIAGYCEAAGRPLPGRAPELVPA